jgi:uncharacterized repeat protein (TIGR01451 family)
MKKILALIAFVILINHAYAQTSCEGPLTLTVTPPSPTGGYAPGTTVNFCLSMDGYLQTNANWFHGVGIAYGPGWDTTTLNPYLPAASCDTQGNWAWYNSCTSSATGIVFGPGFYYESISGSPDDSLDGDPGNNYGDDCGLNIWTFCWSIQTSSTAGASIPLTGSIFITADGTTGSWADQGCGTSYISFNSLLGASPCAASFFYSSVPVENIPFNLYNSSYGINPLYQWTFGDGTTSTVADPVHIYSPKGNYNICLYVNDANGCADSICENLNVVDDFWWTSHPYYITGTVFYDTDSNGVMDLYEPRLENWQLKLQPYNITAYSQQGGDFNFSVNDGDYIVSAVAHAGWTLSTDSTVYHVHVDSMTGSVSGFNFGFKPDQYFSQFQLHFDEGVSACLWNTSQYIDVENTGTNFLNGVISYTKHDSVNVVSTIALPDSIIQNVYYWHYHNLAPFQHQSVELLVDKPDTMGFPFRSIAYADVRDTLNTIMLAQTDTAYEIVTCSYDPNEKIVSPVKAIMGQNYTQIGQTLTYTIRFQNTGTATAQNIAVVDTLSSNLSLNSFHFVSSSFPVDIHSEAGGVITFIFYGINLPDSAANEPGSHGYVQFTVDAIPGIANNTLVQNTASVYFDLNAPVQTSTASTTFVTVIPTGVSENENDNTGIYIYPNPSDGKIVITSAAIPKANDYLVVFDNTGKMILRKPFDTKEQQLDFSSYAAGIYAVKIVQEHKVSVFKLAVK